MTGSQEIGAAAPDEAGRRSQQLEAIGRLAGGIAHDFNNLLTAITGYAELVLEQIEPGHPAHADVQEIFDAAERAGTLTRQLLEFSSREPEDPRILDLNRIVSSLDRMLRRLVGEDVELVSHLDGELWPIQGDPGRIEQVLVNLVVNAREAMPRGGRISIATERQSLGAEAAPEASETPADIPAGDWTTLRVRDSGVGMDSATLERAFEPFFTTRSAEGGTGFGLSTVSEIVDECGGHVRVSSHPNRGSTFTIYFPRATDAPAA